MVKRGCYGPQGNKSNKTCSILSITVYLDLIEGVRPHPQEVGCVPLFLVRHLCCLERLAIVCSLIGEADEVLYFEPLSNLCFLSLAPMIHTHTTQIAFCRCLTTIIVVFCSIFCFTLTKKVFLSYISAPAVYLSAMTMRVMYSVGEDKEEEERH